MAKKKQTPEEITAIVAQIRQQRIDILSTMAIPKPKIFYSVGERVVYGGFEESYILEVFAEGKYYELKTIKHGKNNGASVQHSEDIINTTIVVWVDLIKYDNIKNPRLREKDQFHIQYSNTTIRSLTNITMGYTTTHSYDDVMNWSPEYQRDFVWTDEQKEKLIESMLKNRDIGKFIYYRYPFPIMKETGYSGEMIDGKQRLKAITDFLEGKIKAFGKYFYQMHPYDLVHIDDYSIQLAIIDRPMSIKDRIEYFLHVNTEGVAQSAEHIAKVKEMYVKLVNEQNCTD